MTDDRDLVGLDPFALLDTRQAAWMRPLRPRRIRLAAAIAMRWADGTGRAPHLAAAEPRPRPTPLTRFGSNRSSK
jgi:hypothetical protein